MTELLTAAQMRAIEQAAIESGEVTGLELMERAGRGVVEAIYEEWPEFGELNGAGGAAPVPDGTPPEYLGKDEGEVGGVAGASCRLADQKTLRAVVLCGPGNNGGDGFVVARLLYELGWSVEVFLYGDAEKLPPDARVNYERWCALGHVDAIAPFLERDTWGCDLVVDALFGIGMRRGLPDLSALFWQMQDMVECFSIEPGHDIGRPAIVAVDIPSGVCSDSGRSFPHGGDGASFAAAAHLTVAFHRAKQGHFLAEGASRSGKLRVADIGLDNVSRALGWILRTVNAPGEKIEPVAKLYNRRVVRLMDALHPNWVGKDGHAHKFSHGHALVMSGGFGKTGAARLAARGALRVGAGLVTLGVPAVARAEVAAQITALMMVQVDSADMLRAVLSDGRINALCVGPGLGLGVAQADLVRAVLEAKRPTVLDADALSLVARETALFELLHDGCVLTPHGGEFARLFPGIAAQLAGEPDRGPCYSKVDAARAAAVMAGCTVLFKGPDTVIASPDGPCSIHAAMYDRAAPWLATAGSGDVLAGIIVGLLARGLSPKLAAEIAAWLHVDCARQFGPGLIAEDLPEMLPKVLSDIGR